MHVTTNNKNPLITFALFAYNQEKYIKEAIEGAFNQTYEPLEIILSDDSSTDNTFSIMKEMVSNYKGNAKILLNRNRENIGISKHVRSIHKMSKGEIIIHAAGDDISDPERTSKIYQNYKSQTIKPSLIASNSFLINESGDLIGTYGDGNKITLEIGLNSKELSNGGAPTFAVTRKLVETFPDPDDSLYAEDKILRLRAKLLDGILSIPDRLVKYRISPTGVWSSGLISSLHDDEIIKRRKLKTNDYINIFNQILCDMEYANINCDNITKKYINQEFEILLIWKKILEAKLLESTISLLKGISASSDERWGMFKIWTIRWIPIARKIKTKFT